MKRIDQLLKQKKSPRRPLDEKSIFFLFKKVVREEYGAKGEQSLLPQLLKNNRLFLKARSSNWANEIWTNRQEIIKKINNEIGKDELQDIKVQR
jgi:hypothetical protein